MNSTALHHRLTATAAVVLVALVTMFAGSLSTASASTNATAGDDDGGCYLVYDYDFGVYELWCFGDD